MPLRLTNDRDIHLAQEWIIQLHGWLMTHGLRGYDPFDIKAHPCIRRLQHRPLLRRATTGACDAFPAVSRRLLRVRPASNPKAFALAALGHMRLYQAAHDVVHLNNGLDCLEQLEHLGVAGYAGPCWGYPFPVRAAGLDCPANTPVGVVSAIAGEAYLLAHEITGDARHLDAARGIASFLLQDLPRIACDGEAWCFGYTPLDRRRVHNANLLAVEHVMRTAERAGAADMAAEVQPALAFTLSAQREDGAWPYGAYSPGEPYDPALLALVDHHHTGFVLRSLHGIGGVSPSPEISRALRKGYTYYRKLITPAGMPVNAHGRWPVDIHACAEGILCNSVLSDAEHGAAAAAVLVMRWTHYNLRRPGDGAPWYRMYPLFKSRIVFPRWGVAWMYRALAEYLFASRGKY